MIVKLLTEHQLEFLSLKGGCRVSSESTHVKMSHCWKSYALAHLLSVLAVNHAFHNLCRGMGKFDLLFQGHYPFFIFC